MTDRLYYTDPYLVEFDADVVGDTTTTDGRPAVLLDRTAFYPTSGGQPFDTGTLDRGRVVEVIDAEDGEVLHVVDGEAPRGRVHGRIDWDRRFEHMQQHTGQHVLSAAFAHRFDARTVSFHLGTTSSTIDLAKELSRAQIAEAEREANRIVWEDRPVNIRFASAEEAAKMPLRKEPVRTGQLRLIEVEGFDLSACGGTHVRRTGVIGAIVIAGWERFRGGVRVEFLCGVRAVRAYNLLRDYTGEATRLLSVLPHEVPPSIERLQLESRDLRRQNKDLQMRLAAADAQALLATAEQVGRISLVVNARESTDPNVLKAIASEIAGHPGHLAVLLSVPPPSALVVARSADVDVDAAILLRALTARFGGKGGGKPDLAQGGGLAADPSQVADAVRGAISASAAGA
jgi:alanyl-tRNA synthetase